MNIRPYIRKDHARLQIISIKDKKLLYKISFLTKTRLSQKSGIKEKLENLQICLKQTQKQKKQWITGNLKIFRKEQIRIPIKIYGWGKAMLKGNFVATNVYIKRQESS